jgi:hypothetical protein
MKTKTVLFLLPVIICCLAGCAEPATVEEPEEIPATNETAKVIEFKDLTVEEAQEKIQGRWEVVRYCDDWGCYDYVGYRNRMYHEFMGTDTIRRINTFAPDDSTVFFIPIHSWEKMEYGIQINLKIITLAGSEQFGIYLLHYMCNDTIHCSDPPLNRWWMKKTD